MFIKIQCTLQHSSLPHRAPSMASRCPSITPCSRAGPRGEESPKQPHMLGLPFSAAGLCQVSHRDNQLATLPAELHQAFYFPLALQAQEPRLQSSVLNSRNPDPHRGDGEGRGCLQHEAAISGFLDTKEGTDWLPRPG